MKKLVKLAAVREALDAYGYKEVSYSRMVEMINEQANKELEKLERAKSEQFSFADMRSAYEFASSDESRYDGMTFNEWMSKR
jgi:hypothetical protein